MQVIPVDNLLIEITHFDHYSLKKEHAILYRQRTMKDIKCNKPQKANPKLLVLAMSDSVLSSAYSWLCRQRKDYSHNSDIWDFRQHWPQQRNSFVALVLSGDYLFSPVRRYYINGETVSCWTAQDALLLKAMSIVLADHLTPLMPACCYHLAGMGGTKAAVRDASEALEAGQFVMRTDVKGFYEHVEFFPLYETLCDLLPDPNFCRLVWQSLHHTVLFEGSYHDVTKGLSRSHPMSPLLGAIALLPLDTAMQKLPVYYCRYMDDWVIVAKSRWALRRAIRTMHRVLNRLKFTLHPDKTSIGHVENGFDFLGYHLTLRGLQIAASTLNKFSEHLHRLYEQQASKDRLNAYVRHWLSAVCGGGDIFAKIKTKINTHLVIFTCKAWTTLA